MSKILFIIHLFLILTFLFSCKSDNSTEYSGQIADIYWNKDTYKKGDTGKFYVKVVNDSPKKHHYVVALNILDKNGNIVFDSHKGSNDTDHSNDDCIDFWLESGETKNVGPFICYFRTNDISGYYNVLAGLRIYPWEPVVEFRGTDWCPPIEKFMVEY